MVNDASSARRARHCTLLLAAAWALLGLLASAAALAQNTGFDVHIQQVDDNGEPNHLPDQLAHNYFRGPKTRFRVYVEAQDPALLPFTIILSGEHQQNSRITLSVTHFPPIDQRVYLSPVVEVKKITFLTKEVPKLVVTVTDQAKTAYYFNFTAEQKDPSPHGAALLYTDDYVAKQLDKTAPKPASVPNAPDNPNPAENQKPDGSGAAHIPDAPANPPAAPNTATPTATATAVVVATATRTATAIPTLPIAPVTISVQDAVEESPGTWRSNVKFEPGKTVSLAIVIESDDDPATSITIGKLESAEPGFMITKPAVDEIRLSPKTEHLFNIRFPDGITAARWSFTATCKITLKTTGKSGNRTVPLPQAGMNINGTFYEKNTAIIGIDYTVTIVFPTGAAPQPTVPTTKTPNATSTRTQTPPVSPEAMPAIVIDCADTWRVSRDGESEPYSLTISNKTARDIRAIVTFDPPGLVDCDKLAPGGITIRPGFPQICQLKLSSEGVQRLLQDKLQTLTITATWQQPHPGHATATVKVIARDLLLIALLAIGGIGLVGALATGAFAWLRAKNRDRSSSLNRLIATLPKPALLPVADHPNDNSEKKLDVGLKFTPPSAANKDEPAAGAENRGPTTTNGEDEFVTDLSTAIGGNKQFTPIGRTDEGKRQQPVKKGGLKLKVLKLEKTVDQLTAELNAATRELRAVKLAIQPLLSPDWVRQQLSGAGDELMTELEATPRFSKKLDEIFRASKELPKKNEIRITMLENLSKTYENGLAKLKQLLADKPDRQEADGLRAVLARMIVSHARQVEWILNKSYAEIDSYGSLFESILDWIGAILQQIILKSEQQQDTEVASQLLDRWRKQRSVCREFFAQALAEALSAVAKNSAKLTQANAPASGQSSLSGSPAELATVEALVRYSEQEWDRFVDSVSGTAAGQGKTTVRDTGFDSKAFREEMLRTLFADLAWLLWDVGIIFPNEAREDVNDLLKKLYQHFDVKWIWPVVRSDVFNPELHVRVEVRPSKYPVNTILEVLQLGVIDRGKVLRPAHVRTSRG